MRKPEGCITDETKTLVSTSIPVSFSCCSSTTASFLTSATPRSQNNESITLIWYDSKIERNEIETMEELREINDYVVFYTDKEECINYIASIKNERILFIITLEECTQILLQRVLAFCSIESIFIFRLKSTEKTYPHQLLDKYRHKIVGVFHERCELIGSIRKSVKVLANQQWRTLSFYDQFREKSTRDLTKEFVDFLWFQMFKDVVLQMPKNTYAKQQLIDFCRSYYHGNKKQLEVIDIFEETYPHTIKAIEWYTKQSFVYKLINKALRTEDIELLHIFRFFISDLSSSLAMEYNQQMIDQLHKTDEQVLKLHRGCQLSTEEFENVQQNIGKLIGINGFLSISRSKDVALVYAGTTNDDTHYSVVFEIECNLNELNNSVVIADVRSYSNFPDEDEVLFDLGATFKNFSVEKDDDANIWLIKIKATDDGVHLAKEYIELNRKENDGMSIGIIFGRLLIFMGKFDQAEKYFETILFSDLEQQDVAQVYNSLGTIYHNKGEFEKALQTFQRAYDLMMHLDPPCIKESAGPLNNIGTVIHHKKQYEGALEFYLKALEIDKQLFGENCLRAANTILNVGLIYEANGDFISALNYSKKALTIQRKLLPNDHINIATSLNNIGSVYQAMKEYDLALKYYEEALKMRQKVLPTEHDDIAQSFHNIAEVLHDKGQLPEALEQYFQAVKIREKIFDNINGQLDFAMTLRNIGIVYERLNDHTRAREHYQRALNMMPSDDHSEISELNDYIAGTRRQMS